MSFYMLAVLSRFYASGVCMNPDPLTFNDYWLYFQYHDQNRSNFRWSRFGTANVPKHMLFHVILTLWLQTLWKSCILCCEAFHFLSIFLCISQLLQISPGIDCLDGKKLGTRQTDRWLFIKLLSLLHRLPAALRLFAFFCIDSKALYI